MHNFICLNSRCNRHSSGYCNRGAPCSEWIPNQDICPIQIAESGEKEDEQ